MTTIGNGMINMVHRKDAYLSLTTKNRLKKNFYYVNICNPIDFVPGFIIYL